MDRCYWINNEILFKIGKKHLQKKAASQKGLNTDSLMALYIYVQEC